MDKKTARKNQTNLAINWPTEDEYWTVKELHARNPQFKPEITVRVRLSAAIKKHNTVAVIGDKMNSHGRPEMVCAMRQKDGKVKQSTIDAAKKAGIRCGEPTTTIVAKINPSSQSSSGPQPAAVNINPAQVNKPVTV